MWDVAVVMAIESPALTLNRQAHNTDFTYILTQLLDACLELIAVRLTHSVIHTGFPI